MESVVTDGSSSPSLSSSSPVSDSSVIRYVTYESEHQLPLIRELIDRDLSESYSVITYRFFVNNWPNLTIMAMIDKPQNESDGLHSTRTTNTDISDGRSEIRNSAISAYSTSSCVGVIVCKLSSPSSSSSLSRGYIAMLSVSPSHRHRGLASQLVSRALSTMKDEGGDLCSLETELSNTAAINLYEKFNFVRDVRLPRYYLNGSDAFRLKLWFTTPEERAKKQKEKEKTKEENKNRKVNKQKQQQTIPIEK